MGDVRILGSAEVKSLLTMEECIEVIDDALRTASRGDLLNPLRIPMKLGSGGGNLLGYMPGALGVAPGYANGVFGAKLVSIFPANHDRGLPSHQGTVMIFDPETGSPLGILDGTHVTGIRTAAASAVATRALARGDASTLAVLGYGEQAREHIRAMAAVRNITRVTVWGRNPDKASAFAEANSDLVPGASFGSAAKVEDAVADADIICTTTAATEPVLKGAWVRPGTHINAVGACQPHAAEVDSDLVARSRYYVDYRPSAEAEAGQYLHALKAGMIQPDHILGEVGAVLDRNAPGRQCADDITLFESLGFAAEDLAAACFLIEKAARENVGVIVSF